MEFEAAFFGLITPILTVLIVSGMYTIPGTMVLICLIMVAVLSIINPL